jgi:hypothetical protein
MGRRVWTDGYCSPRQLTHFKPFFLDLKATHDVAGTIHQSLETGEDVTQQLAGTFGVPLKLDGAPGSW